MLKKLNILMLFMGLSMLSFSQDEIKPCGQLPTVNPTLKPKCNNDMQKVFSQNLPSSFNKEKSYNSSFKLIVDCNGRIDMVIYKKGNFSESQQKHFLTLINTLKDWNAGQVDGKDVSTTVYITIDVNKRVVSFKVY